jgi:hypothetical protein
MNKRFNPLIGRLMDDREIMYAVKHHRESMIEFHGYVTLEHFRRGELIHKQAGSNIFTTEGRNHILDIIFGSTEKDSATYVGIFKQNITPVAGDTAAAKLGAAGTYGECQDADYTPLTNRPAYTVVAAASSSCTNAASPAVFTIVASSITVYGAFITNTAAKTSTSGALICAKAFSPSRAVITGDVLSVTYAISTTSS